MTRTKRPKSKHPHVKAIWLRGAWRWRYEVKIKGEWERFLCRWSDYVDEANRRDVAVLTTGAPWLPTDEEFVQANGGGMTFHDGWLEYEKLYAPKPGQHVSFKGANTYTQASWEQKKRVYLQDIKPWAGHRPLSEVIQDDMTFCAKLRAKHAEGLSNRALAIEFRAIIVRLRDARIIPADTDIRVIRAPYWPGNIISKRVTLKAPVCLNATDLGDIARIILEHPRLEWVYVAACGSVLSGCRNSEIRAWTWADIDFDANIISVNKQLWGRDTEIGCKAGSEGPAPLYEPLKVILQAWKERRKAQIRERVIVPLDEGGLEQRLAKERVILTSAGTSPTRQQLLSGLYRLADLAGIKRKSIHSGRHTTATEVLRSASVTAAMKVMRHASIRSTEKYEAEDDSIIQATRDKVVFRIKGGQ